MHYQFPPQLDYKQVTMQLKTVVTLLKQNRGLDIDLANICRLDSAGIALLIDLRNLANRHNWQLNYLSPTTEVLKLCSLYGVSIL
jgi:ABC-type transporter Mla MlaB component